MSEMDLMKSLSEIDEALVMKPRRFVSLRMNLLLCIVSANISRFFPVSGIFLRIAAYLICFGLLYLLVFFLLNVGRSSKLLVEGDPAP